jgi:hypothetical protein
VVSLLFYFVFPQLVANFIIIYLFIQYGEVFFLQKWLLLMLIEQRASRVPLWYCHSALYWLLCFGLAEVRWKKYFPPSVSIYISWFFSTMGHISPLHSDLAPLLPWGFLSVFMLFWQNHWYSCSFSSSFFFFCNTEAWTHGLMLA